jgi:hypothetical protein
VSLSVGENEKAAMVALATITSDDMKLPLLIIVKDKTKRVDSTQLGNIKED